MFAILTIMFIQPSPVPAVMPERGPVTVDVLVVNQFINTCVDDEGKRHSRTFYYLSFWSVHNVMGMPVWEHRGWTHGQPLIQCTDGWGCMSGGRLIVGRGVLFLVTDHDFEYRNRHWNFGRWIR